MKAKTRSLPFGEAIDSFVLYLAVEKGLSNNYQLSNRRSLQELAEWCAAEGLPDPRSVQTADLTNYLGTLKARGLAPASLRIVIIAIRLFYCFLCRRSYGDGQAAGKRVSGYSSFVEERSCQNFWVRGRADTRL
jgi:site-specific recombinase XerD